MTKVAIVIPNWNGLDKLPSCLTSLKGVKADIIVVDNGSSDGSVAFLQKHDNIYLITLPHNTGFTGGVNAGIAHANNQGYEWVALLNNDAIAKKDWLKNLTSSIDKNTGIITSKILLSDKKHIDSTGDFLSTRGLPFPRGRNEVDTGQYDQDTDVFGASGGASLYRVAMLKEIGLFDDDYFAYFEDVDMSMRARMRGWEVRYQPKAIVYHEIGGTSSKMGDFASYHTYKNFLLLYARNMPTRLYFKYLPLFTLQFLRLMAGALLLGKLRTFCRAIYAAAKLHPQTKKIRKENLAKQTISNKELDALLYHHRPPKPPAIIPS